jgi:hypothetical protein
MVVPQIQDEAPSSDIVPEDPIQVLDAEIAAIRLQIRSTLANDPNNLALSTFSPFNPPAYLMTCNSEAPSEKDFRRISMN